MHMILNVAEGTANHVCLSKAESMKQQMLNSWGVYLPDM